MTANGQTKKGGGLYASAFFFDWEFKRVYGLHLDFALPTGSLT